MSFFIPKNHLVTFVLTPTMIKKIMQITERKDHAIFETFFERLF